MNTYLNIIVDPLEKRALIAGVVEQTFISSPGSFLSDNLWVELDGVKMTGSP